MSRISEDMREAVEDAASVERDGGGGYARVLSVEASTFAVRKFRARLRVFLLAMPEDATVREMWEELAPRRCYGCRKTNKNDADEEIGDGLCASCRTKQRRREAAAPDSYRKLEEERDELRARVAALQRGEDEEEAVARFRATRGAIIRKA